MWNLFVLMDILIIKIYADVLTAAMPAATERNIFDNYDMFKNILTFEYQVR